METSEDRLAIEVRKLRAESADLNERVERVEKKRAPSTLAACLNLLIGLLYAISEACSSQRHRPTGVYGP